MSFYSAPCKSTEPEARAHIIRLLGAGTTVPTIELGGKLVTIARNGVGDITLTWKDSPGVFCTVMSGLHATTIANVKNCSVTPGAYSASGKTLQILIWSSAGAARDLATAEYLDLTVWFKQTGV